ncbi:MAG: 16S rRNA (cytidine(1402)-2'-O)-methyltransferase [Desulfobacterales bacterium]
MPSTSAPDSRPPSGVLYVVATPIGHREDITLRALSVLQAVHLVAAEDTRKSGELLRHFGIHARLVSYHEHNEAERTPQLLSRLLAGEDIALVTNAGTPGISDPGYRLVSAAARAGVRVVPVPGASAAIAALSASGLPTDAFVFEGFLPKREGPRRKRLVALAAERRTIILYESPHRLAERTAELLAVLGDRPAVLARELTKVHEEFLRGPLSELTAELERRGEIRGECTLLIGPAAEGTPPGAWEQAREEIRQGTAAGREPRGLIREIAARHGLPRNALYREALHLKKEAEPNPGRKSPEPQRK